MRLLSRLRERVGVRGLAIGREACAQYVLPVSSWVLASSGCLAGGAICGGGGGALAQAASANANDNAIKDRKTLDMKAPKIRVRFAGREAARRFNRPIMSLLRRPRFPGKTRR